MLTIGEAVAILSDSDLAVSAAAFPADRVTAAAAGLYSWWVDDEGRRTLEESLGESLTGLIYAGRAGATSMRSGKASSATLASRIRNNHIGGTAHGSTFRKSLSAILLEPLGLVVEGPDRLRRSDNERVSEWIRDHLSVVVVGYEDREGLGSFEEGVLRVLDPPLNIDGMPTTAVRQRLTTLRRALSRPSHVATQKPIGGAPEIEEALDTRAAEPGQVRFMVPTGGPDDWRALLADPELHWVVGRSARTLAHAWEDAKGWPPEIQASLAATPELAEMRPVYGFPEFKTPLPGGSRASQTDLMVVATDGKCHATFAIEGKVDEPFGEMIKDWLGPSPSTGKVRRLEFLAGLLGVDVEELLSIRYQLVHRAASAKLEAARCGSDIAVMLVHSWAPALEGFADFSAFARPLGSVVEPGAFSFSDCADLWLGWMVGDPKYLAS